MKRFLNHKSAFSLVEISIVLLIIGVLIAGIATGSKLISESKLKSAQALTKASVINGLDGLIFWLDTTATNVITNTSDSYKISTNDRAKTFKDSNSKNIGFTFSEISSGAGPTYVAKGINGLPSLSFGGNAAATSGDCLKTTFSPKLDPLNFSLFVVANPITLQTGSIVTLYSNNNIGSAGSIKLYEYIPDSSSIYWNVNISSALPTSNTTTNTVTVGTATVLSFIHNEPPAYPTTLNKLYRKGVLAFTNSSVYHTVNDVMASTDALYIGCSYNGSAGEFYNGYISEIILFDRVLSDEDRSEVEKYLMKKYDIRV